MNKNIVNELFGLLTVSEISNLCWMYVKADLEYGFWTTQERESFYAECMRSVGKAVFHK